LDNFLSGEALDALEAPVTEKGRSLSHELIFLMAAVLAPFDLIDSTVRRHNPPIRTQPAIVSGPMGIDHIDLSPIVPAGIGNGTIYAVFCLRPVTVKILHVVKFREAPAIRTHKYQRIWKKSDPAGLVKDKLSLINEGFVLVIEECTVDALFGQNSRFRSAICGTLEPALDIFRQVFK
jgi:hypothetical protein